jgi:hypothetical protein
VTIGSRRLALGFSQGVASNCDVVQFFCGSATQAMAELVADFYAGKTITIYVGLAKDGR